jgi:hypothetical protein
MGTAVTFVGRKAKSTSAKQYGKFQLFLKGPIGHYSALSEKTNVGKEHNENRTKPSPYLPSLKGI